jgi:hypothetical protein
MLEPDYKKRWNVEQILSSSWLNQETHTYEEVVEVMQERQVALDFLAGKILLPESPKSKINSADTSCSSAE